MKIYYTYDRELPEARLEDWLRELPENRQGALGRLKQPHKRRISLIGTRLLKSALHGEGFRNAALSQIKFPKDGKPSLPLPVDFSISHSGALIACAFSTNGRVGLDIEMLRPMDAQAFRRMFTDDERTHAGSDPRRFFDLWSRKEAVIKAWGDGGVWDMPKVQLQENHATLGGTRWHLHALAVDPGYAAHLATEHKPDGLSLHPMEVSDLP